MDQRDGRAFPVTVDPSVVKYGNTISDSFVSSYISNGNYGEETYLEVGYVPTLGFMRIFSRMNSLPSVPDGAVISSATFNMKQYSYENYGISSLTLAAVEVLASWDEVQMTLDGEGICWSNMPSCNSQIIDSATVSEYTNGNLIDFDITVLANKWYSGYSNYGLSIYCTNEYMCSETYFANAIFYSSDSSGVYSTTTPIYVVGYRLKTGLEDYYSYHTQNIGDKGIGYVNDYNGALVYTQDLGFSGAFPFEINSIYNSFYDGTEYSSYYNVATNNFGKGWKISTYERLTNEPGLGYVYHDNDGTEHCFDYISDQGFYLDKDRTGLKLEVGSTYYTLTNGYTKAVKTFSVSNGRLSTITSDSDTYSFTYTNAGGINQICTNGVTIYQFTYTNGYLTSITDDDSKTASFAYSNGLLSTITAVNGEIYTFTYNSTTNILSNVKDNKSNYNITYSYETSNGFGRIEKIQEAIGTTLGQAIAITYEDHKTTFRSSGADDVLATITSSTDLTTIDDLLTVYLFDDYMDIINVYTTNAAGNVLYESTAATYSNTDTFAAGDNNVQAVATTGSGNPNLLFNSSFEGTNNWTEKTYGTTITDAITNYVTANYFIGNKSLAVIVPTTNNSVYGKYQSVLLAAGTYTLSSYIRTYNIAASGGGALLSVYNSSNTLLANSEMLTGTSNADIQNGWRRISVTFTLTATTTVYLHLGLKNATGAAYFDAVRLDKGNAYNTYDLLTNGGFDLSNSNAEWTTNNCGYSTSAGLFGTTALELDDWSCPGNTSASQTIPVNAVLGTNFVISGWGNAASIAKGGNSKFGINVTVNYNASSSEIFYIPFNYNILSKWQYVSKAIIPTNTTTGDYITSITVSLLYYYNTGAAYFDNISLTVNGVNVYDNTESTNKIFDTYGNLTSETVDGVVYTYTHDSNGNVLTITVDNILKTTYTYDSNNNILTETTDNIRYTYTYDTNNNVASTTIAYVGSTTVTNGDDVFYTSATYDSDGNQLTSTNEFANTTTYTYNNNNITSITDARNNTTNYTYTNDVLTRLWTTINSTEVSNYFTYNSFGSISGINHTVGGTSNLTFNFTYDTFGNLTSILQGTTTLVTYTYNSYNGKLTRTRYYSSTNLYIDYIYDAVDRVVSIEYNDVVKYSFKYDEKSNLLEAIDNVNDITEKYEYDLNYTLIHSYQITTSSKAFIYTKEYEFNTDGENTGYSYIFANGTKTGNSYTFNDDNTISSVGLSNGYSKNYVYDVFGRNVSDSIKNSSNTNILSATYGYLDSNRITNGSSNVVGTITYNDATVLTYSYDATGNITSILRNGSSYVSYVYDALGQMTRENNVTADDSYVYAYDNNGNILSKKTYDYTSGILGTCESTINYTYGNTNNNTQLTNYNGASIAYDSLGNPLNWSNASSLTWSGRELSTVVLNSNNTLYFKYNANGIRTNKNYLYYLPGGDTATINTEYVLDGTKIIRETRSGNENATLYYYYDENDSVIGFNYNGTDYYYRKNLQGDVESICNASGAVVVSYAYDAWGKIINISGTLASTIGEINPFRYRSYYYDTETGFYSLHSRYYDPEIGRFINADVPESMILQGDSSILATNLFAYCFNNPVNYADHSGMVVTPANVIGAIIGAGAGALIGVLLVSHFNLTGWKKWLVIGGSTALVAIIGWFAGPVIYKAITAITPMLQDAIEKGKLAYNKIATSVSRFLGLLPKCFVAGTLIKTQDGERPIEEIKIGDMVYAEDPETGEKGLKRVTDVYVNETEVLIEIEVNQTILKSTPEHPFWVIDKGWIEAERLIIGDKLKLSTGEIAIINNVNKVFLNTSVKVYNFTVEDWHTYYAGELSVLTHNLNCNDTAQKVISAERKGSIRREFPKEYLNKTVQQIIDEKNKGIAAARKAWKLLNDNRWKK